MGSGGHEHRTDAQRGDLELLAGLPLVIGGLLSKPDASGSTLSDTQPGFQAQGQGGRDGGAPIEHARQRHARDTELFGCIGHGQAERGQNIVAQRQAGMGGFFIMSFLRSQW